MMQVPGGPELDALADAIAQRLGARFPGGIPKPGGPTGEPDLERPNLTWDPYSSATADVLPRPRLGIAGMELTQSIQHHGAAGPSYGADNSVPLIALKTLVVRVYPHVRPGLGFLDDLTGCRVTGELIVSYGDRVAYRTGPTRAAGVRIGPQRLLDRTLWDEEFTGLVPGPSLVALQQYHVNCSLNFIVPAYYCRGSRTTFSVRIWRAADGPSSSYHATASEVVKFLAVPAPCVCLVRVNWTDANGNTNRPSDATMLSTLRLAERMLPFPYFETTILGIEQTSTAAFAMVPASAGGCNVAWQKLLTELAVTRIFTVLFGLGDIVFGLVSTAAIPAGAKKINSGCGIEAGGCFVGYDETFAHEFGHLYECRHVAVPGDPSSDPNYPNYGGDLHSIGEVGIDTGTSPPTLFDPASADDIMSYQPNLWISPYTYERILDNWELHMNAPTDPRRVRPVLVISLRLHRIVREASRVEVRQAHRVEAAGMLCRHASGRRSRRYQWTCSMATGASSPRTTASTCPRTPAVAAAAGVTGSCRRNASRIWTCTRSSNGPAKTWRRSPSIVARSRSPRSRWVKRRASRSRDPSAARAACSCASAPGTRARQLRSWYSSAAMTA